jgi:IS5 family transposase
MQFLAPSLKELLNPREGLYRLAEKIPWGEFEKQFGALYSPMGRPAKPVRLMVSLLLLKQMFNLGDETVVEAWVQNPYWQFFSGETVFQWKVPIEPSDLVHFRKRIGEAGVEKILAVSVALHGKKAQEKEIVIDTTVQEKNITYPTEAKLHRRMIEHCRKIARRENILLRQSYQRTIGKLMQAQRWWHHPKNGKRARAAARHLKTIAGRLVRELERKLPVEKKEHYQAKLELYQRVLRQQRQDHNKIYSLHEPQVYCVAKGKEHKKYEFGTKASVVMTKTSGVIVGALSLEKHQYDGHTLPAVLQQAQQLRGVAAEVAIVDRGYRGRKMEGTTRILSPQRGSSEQSPAEKQKMRKRFRRRSAIEPVIGHLKSQYRLARNFLKGSVGDRFNLMLAAAAFNLRKWLRQASSFLFLFFRSFYHIASNLFPPFPLIQNSF